MCGVQAEPFHHRSNPDPCGSGYQAGGNGAAGLMTWLGFQPAGRGSSGTRVDAAASDAGAATGLT